MTEGKEEGMRERESIIEKILKEKRKISLQEARDLGYHFDDYTEEYPDVYRYLLRYGAKVLIITIDAMGDPKVTEDDGEVNTFIGNIEGEKHKDEETTLLYTAARLLIEEECRNTKKRLLYVLETRDSKMIAWAQTKGKQIFDWDTERTQAGENYIITGIHCEKLFLPPE